MYNYPLTFSFSSFAMSPKIEVKDASGQVVFAISKKLLSSKDEIEVTAGGQPRFKVLSQESRITDIPSNWDILAADGTKIGVVDDDFISALDTTKFTDNRFVGGVLAAGISQTIDLTNLKMYWLKDAEGHQLGCIAPEQKSLMAQQLPLYEIVKKLPFFFRFITPFYYIRLGEQTVMKLQKNRTFFTDTYTLEVSGQFNEKDEALLIPSVALAIIYEREQLKHLYN